MEEHTRKVMAFVELTRVGSQWAINPSTEKMSTDVYKTLKNFGVNV